MAESSSSVKLRFPEKSWMSSYKRPSEVILEQLFRRQFLRFLRKGMSRKEARYATEDLLGEDDQLRAKYNLPKETHKWTLTAEEFYHFQKLNSFRATRAQAREYFEKHKHLSTYQD